MELDAGTVAFGGDGVPGDLLAEGAVLAPLVADQDEARVPGLRLERLHLLDGHDRFGHGTVVPRRLAANRG